MTTTLADRVMALRHEVLETAEVGDGDLTGGEVFDAVVRTLQSHEETSPGLDLTLHDAISRRLAWGDSEDEILATSDRVCKRLGVAAQRSLDDPVEEALVCELASEVACAAARLILLSSAGRAGRERVATLREERTQQRLRDALSRQDEARTQLQKRTGRFPHFEE